MKKILLVTALVFLLTGCLKQNQTNVGKDDQPTTNPESIITASPSETKQAVPLPTREDIIRTFFNLVNEKRISEAVEMMSTKMIPDDASKQGWGVQLNSFKSIKVEKVEPCKSEPCSQNWVEEEKEIYKVILLVEMRPEAAQAPIPYYGWDNGQNTRWLNLEKQADGLWQITSISTGP